MYLLVRPEFDLATTLIMRQLELMDMVRRKLLPAGLVILAHAALFAALAVPRARPLQADRETIDVALVGPVYLGSPTLVPQPPVSVTSPSLPKPPPPPAPLEPVAPAVETEDVAELAAHLIRDTSSRELTAQPLEQLSATAAPPPTSAAEARPSSAPDSARCEIGDALQAVFQGDPAVQHALSGVPNSGRSVANAIMLWDGDWVDPRLMGGEAVLGPVKSAILSGVLAASPDCRQQAVTGPRFVVVAAGGSTMVVTVGSGVWRWADLLNENPSQSP